MKRQQQLSIREKQILKKISFGYSSKEIAAGLFISLNTVNTHRKNILRKLGVNNIISALKYLNK